MSPEDDMDLQRAAAKDWFRSVLDGIDLDRVTLLSIEAEVREVPSSGDAIHRELTGKRTVTIEIDDRPT